MYLSTSAFYYIFVSPFEHYSSFHIHLPPYTTTHILVLLLAIPHVFIFFPIFAYYVHMMLMLWPVGFNYMPGFERFPRLSTYNNVSIHEWYDQNKLVIHKSKSSVMLATTRQRILYIGNNNLDVHIGDYKLVQSDCIDYLGVKNRWNHIME